MPPTPVDGWSPGQRPGRVIAATLRGDAGSRGLARPTHCPGRGRRAVRVGAPNRLEAGPARARGFTLIELLTAIVLTALLLTLATPSLRTFIQNRRITTATNDLIAAIYLARTEAMTRGASVTLCRTGDPNDLADGDADDDPTCQANVYPGGATNATKDWSPGWLMYALPVGDMSAPRDYDKTTDTLVAVGTPAPEGVSITANTDGQTYLAFFGDGSQIVSNNPTSYAICDQRGPSVGTAVTVPRGGRPAVGTATNCTP